MKKSRRLSGLAAGILLSAGSAHAQTNVQFYGLTCRQARPGLPHEPVGRLRAGGPRKALLSVAGTRKRETAMADVKRTTWSLGYDYDLSRRTDLYVVAMRDSVTGLQSGTTLAMGVRHRF